MLERRLNECSVQLEAIREGLGFMVNLDSLRGLTWEELECAVCGNEDFDVEALKVISPTIYVTQWLPFN